MNYKVRIAVLFLEAIIISVALTQSDLEDDLCYTPDSMIGNCINLKNCPILLSRMTSPNRQESDVWFVNESTCGFEGVKGKEPKVCCPIDEQIFRPLPNFEVTPTAFEQQNSSFESDEGSYELQSENLGQQENNNPPHGWNHGHSESKFGLMNDIRELLPSDCGIYLPNRIIGGSSVELDEYPWLSLLEYRKSNGKIAISCGGALISERYILTAAHCVVGSRLPKTWRLESVRLGEYNTTAERDCISDDDNDNAICIEDSPLTIRIEEEIVHEDYDPLSNNQRYDIALLRLSQNIAFTSYIKPICLPSHIKIDENLTVAGWGSTEFSKASKVKLKVSIPLVDNKKCVDIYLQNGIILGDGQICAGGVHGKDSCRGDSGGPLMQQDISADNTPRWTAIGVVSFGPSPCGQAGIPGVYTRVFDYMPWVMNKLKL